MTDLKRRAQRDGVKEATPAGPARDAEQHASSTRGTDRDRDRSGRSANQRHGHPREQRRGD
jgi:hypothetical protein